MNPLLLFGGLTIAILMVKSNSSNKSNNSKTYRIERGDDTLYQIAQKLTGNGDNWQQIVDLNPNEKLYYAYYSEKLPGQTFVLAYQWFKSEYSPEHVTYNYDTVSKCGITYTNENKFPVKTCFKGMTFDLFLGKEIQIPPSW